MSLPRKVELLSWYQMILFFKYLYYSKMIENSWKGKAASLINAAVRVSISQDKTAFKEPGSSGNLAFVRTEPNTPDAGNRCGVEMIKHIS